jgi:apolipoprotein N-acyltransferase
VTFHDVTDLFCFMAACAFLALAALLALFPM